MKLRILSLSLLIGVLSLSSLTQAQTTNSAPSEAVVAKVNSAIVPVSRAGANTKPQTLERQALVLERAKSAPGSYDIEFIGDSITQGWESAGKEVWQELGAKHKIINFGVGGDRTQHVLWRFEQGQLSGIKAKAAVVMIGTNNSNKDDNSEADILEGVSAIVAQIRERQPDTKILLCAIFPRGKSFSAQRGKILQVNQALAKLDDGKSVFYVDFGSQLIEKDGSIAPEMMKDALHPGEQGYRIWAAALEPKLKEILAEK